MLTVHRFRRAGALLLAAGLVTAAPWAAAQEATACEVRDRSPELVVMVCKPASNPTQWRAAAQAACGEERSRCNVWIWTSLEDAPKKAPKLDADIPKQNTAKAVAVWANDTQSLLQVRKR